MIYHIATDQDLELCRNNSFYAPQRFAKEGFIHASTSKQISKTANTIFKSHQQIWLLFIDDEKEKQFIKVENLEGGQELFPHIYRRIPKESIVKMIQLSKTPTNSFDISVEVLLSA